MKIYKSTRARKILEERGEKFVTFGKDDKGYFIVSKPEEDGASMIERRLSFTEDCIVIKSVSTGSIKFVPEVTTETLEIVNY